MGENSLNTPKPHGLSEAERLAALETYPIEDGDVRKKLDRLARLAATVCGAPVGLVSLVGSDRQVFVGRAGTELAETPRAWSFCDHAMRQEACMTVPDAGRDERFADNPLVTGEPGIRFYAGQPLRSPEGLPLGAFCVIDTKPRPALDSEQCETLETLAEAAMAILEKARIEARSRKLAEEQSWQIEHHRHRFETLADAMPQLVWATTPDGQVDYLNRGWREFTGRPLEDSYGHKWLGFLHPDDAEKTAGVWSESLESRKPYEIEYRLFRHDGQYRWQLARGLPMLAPDGEILRWIGTCTDIHDQKETSDLLAILSRELNHRIKNIFAVIGGLIALTVRRHPEARDLGRDLQDRILALGRAHDYVRTDARGEFEPHPHTSLKGMLEALLAPYGARDEARFTMTGQDIAIDDRSATPLALYFHELATNAAKYGALSADDGTVEIALSENGDDAELTWSESGGPPVLPSSENGFGAALIDMSIHRQLGGRVEYDWRRTGLVVRAIVPRSALAREGNT